MRCARVIARGKVYCGCGSDRAAALLAFGAWTAVAAIAATATLSAFAAEPTTAATTTTTALAAIALTAVLAAGRAMFAFAAGAAVVAATEAAITAIAIAAVAVLAVATRIALARSGVRGLAAAEETLEPAEEAAGFLRRLGLRSARFARRTVAVRARLTRFAGAVVAAGFTGLETARLARLAGIARLTWLALLARIAGLAGLTRIARLTLVEGLTLTLALAAFAWLAAFARGLEGRALVALTGALRLCFPARLGAAGRLGREDVELGLGRGFVLRWLDIGVNARSRDGHRSRGLGVDGSGSGGRSRSGSGREFRLVGARRAHRRLAGERILVFGLRRDDREGRRLIAGGGSAGGGRVGGRALGLAPGEAGTACEDVDAACRRIIDDAGFGEFFIHRTGHGIGVEEHEDPYIVAGNRSAIEVGNAWSIEPGIYLPGRFGMRLEDIVVATEAGSLSLNRADHALAIVG